MVLFHGSIYKADLLKAFDCAVAVTTCLGTVMGDNIQTLLLFGIQ